ncbi:hypothetical protein SUGI_1189210 [Cryptomeria japonica]|nr:hypothetical protein SUGI_1189210 [Cryptomeria japonica]
MLSTRLFNSSEKLPFSWRYKMVASLGSPRDGFLCLRTSPKRLRGIMRPPCGRSSLKWSGDCDMAESIMHFARGLRYERQRNRLQCDAAPWKVSDSVSHNLPLW